MNWTLTQKLESSSPAVTLPETIGVEDTDILVVEDGPALNSITEALAMVETIEDAPSTVVVKALVPKLPASFAKEIDKLRAKLPESRDKLNALVQPHPVTGEDTWKTTIEQEIIQRNQQVKVKFKTCKGCGSTIAVTEIRTIPSPTSSPKRTATSSRPRKRRSTSFGPKWKARISVSPRSRPRG